MASGDRYTIKSDSVGGHPCVIVYRDTKPVFAAWLDEPCAPCPVDMDTETGVQLMELIRTTKDLGGKFPDIERAAVAFLKERFK